MCVINMFTHFMEITRLMTSEKYLNIKISSLQSSPHDIKALFPLATFSICMPNILGLEFVKKTIKHPEY